MQGAQLDADDQDDRVLVGDAELARCPQRRHRRVAAHEPEVEALHRIGQPESAHDLVFRSGSVEPGAGHRDDVSHILRADLGSASRARRATSTKSRAASRV